MRTKTLLLTAALTAAGVATSMAQAVYSVNMVGYINQSLPAGFSLIGNQLNHSPDNRLETVFANPPENTTIYQFNPNGGGYIFKRFTEGSWTGDADDVFLDPGRGTFIQLDAPYTHTYVGEVDLDSAIPLIAGFNLYSSALPQKLPVDAAPPAGLGLPVQEGDEIHKWNGVGYSFHRFTEGSWTGDSDTAPEPEIGEAFWYNNKNAQRDWARTFSVGP